MLACVTLWAHPSGEMRAEMMLPFLTSGLGHTPSPLDSRKEGVVCAFYALLL